MSGRRHIVPVGALLAALLALAACQAFLTFDERATDGSDSAVGSDGGGALPGAIDANDGGGVVAPRCNPDLPFGDAVQLMMDTVGAGMSDGVALDDQESRVVFVAEENGYELFEAIARRNGLPGEFSIPQRVILGDPAFGDHHTPFYLDANTLLFSARRMLDGGLPTQLRIHFAVRTSGSNFSVPKLEYDPSGDFSEHAFARPVELTSKAVSFVAQQGAVTKARVVFDWQGTAEGALFEALEYSDAVPISSPLGRVYVDRESADGGRDVYAFTFKDGAARQGTLVPGLKLSATASLSWVSSDECVAYLTERAVNTRGVLFRAARPAL